MSDSTGTIASTARWRIWLRLGRVSNLPTVWSNTIAGVCLGWAGLYNGEPLATHEFPGMAQLVLSMLAFSLIYVGGMFLNDAYDAEIDAKERADRPIPAGIVSRRQVFFAGFAVLIVGVLIVAVITAAFTDSASASGSNPARSPLAAVLSASALAAMVVLYDLWHKNNPLSPLLMGICRALVYVTAAFIVTGFAISSPLVLGVVALLGYLIGLTAIAKQEHLQSLKSFWPLVLLFMPPMIAVWLSAEFSAWVFVVIVLFTLWIVYVVRALVENKPGAIPRCVVMMIAAISLVDMLMVAAVAVLGNSNGGIPVSGVTGTGIALWAWTTFCLLCFGTTLVLQRFVPGT